MKRTAVAALAVAACLLLAGCGQEWDDAHGKGDAPVTGGRGDDTPAAVTNFPDGFGNVATKCVAGAPGRRAYVTTNTTAAPSHLIIEADPGCK